MPTKRDPKDNEFSKGDAIAQARQITEFWRRRGYHITAKVVPIAVDTSQKKRSKIATGFRLETNLINGLPPELANKGGRLA